MGQISLTIPTAGSTDFGIAAVNVDSDLQTIQTWANGNVDATNVTTAFAAAAGVNQSGQTVKGAVNIATSESRTNTAYGTLTTPDQVTGIVLPANGLIRVRYQATWQESVANAARAAIFVGANQLQAVDAASGAQPIAAATNSGTPAVNHPLATALSGLLSCAGPAYGGDATTGQAVGLFTHTGGTQLTQEIGGAVFGSTTPGGSCDIFAAAGTYTISVQFKASSGSVTVANRKLWVQALSFA